MKKQILLSIALGASVLCANAESIDGHEYVDLDLPSGLLWATCNVGANTSTEVGSLFAWGETSAKTEFTWENYKYGNAADSITKYCITTKNGKNGFTDGRTTLEDADDAAFVNWGSNWQTPTADDWCELKKNCSWEVICENTVAKYIKISSYTTGQTLQLPLDSHNYGAYWSSSLCNTDNYHSDEACQILLYSMGMQERIGHCWANAERYLGKHIRPVRTKTSSTLTCINVVDFTGIEFIGGQYKQGQKMSLRAAKAETGWTFDRWETMGFSLTESQATNPNLTLTMPSRDATLTATYKKLEFTISVEDSENGKITPSKTVGNYNDEVSLTVEPAEGYELALLTLRTDAGDSLVVTNDKFTIPLDNVNIKAEFAKPSGFSANHGWVDLGLPSKLKWSTMNIGSIAPNSTGNYYAWGEVETKDDYTETNYKYSVYDVVKDDRADILKYTVTTEFGTPDSLLVLEPEDDAAVQNWHGAWRMATMDEWDELFLYCDTIWQMNYQGTGINGFIFKSRANGNHIFLPASGAKWQANLWDLNSLGEYWTSSLDATTAKYPTTYHFRDIWCEGFEFDLKYHSWLFYNPVVREFGYSVRAVADVYLLDIADMQNGKVVATGVDSEASYVATGSKVTLIVTPDAGYALVDGSLKVLAADGTALTLDANNQFTMPKGDVTVSASFVVVDYSVSVSATEHGTVTPSRTTAQMGDTVSLAIVPETGYRAVISAKCGNNEVAIAADSTFVMPAGDVAVSASFVKEDYAIAIAATTNGALSANRKTAQMGETVSIEVIPCEGAELTSLVVKYGENVVDISENHTFVMPASAVEVVAVFTKIEYKITVNACEHGTVQAVATAQYRDDIALTITPEAGYRLATLEVVADAKSVKVTDNAFKMPANDVSISATFEKINYAIAIAECENGSVACSRDSAQVGDIITLDVTVDAGCHVTSFVAKTAETSIEVAENHTFVMPAGAVEVVAVIEKIDYKVTIAACEHGRVEANCATAHLGDEVLLSATPDKGFMLSEYSAMAGAQSVEVNTGKFVVPSFLMPASDVVVSAIFVEEGTALDEVSIGSLYAENGRIYGADEMLIFDILGRDVTRLNGQLSGVYVVKIGNKAQKVIVR